MRGSISSQLRNSLQGLNIASDLLEQAVQLVTNDNLDLGCALIEQAATEKVRLLSSLLNANAFIRSVEGLGLLLLHMVLPSFF